MRDTSSQRGWNSRKDSDILNSPFSIFNYKVESEIQWNRLYLYAPATPAVPRWRKAYSAHITARKSPASANAVAAAGERGADISAHRSQQLTAEMAKDAKYLVCMTGAHYDRLCELFPDCADKIFTLLPEDISDPFGGDLATYRRSAAEIDKGVQAVIKNLSR